MAVYQKVRCQGADTLLSTHQPPSSITKATASLENSRRCEKLNSSDMSMRLRVNDHQQGSERRRKAVMAHSLALWMFWFELANELSMVKMAGYPAFSQEA